MFPYYPWEILIFTLFHCVIDFWVFSKTDKKIFCILYFYVRRRILMDKIYNSDLVFMSVRSKFELLES